MKKGTYTMYYDHKELVNKVALHRVLAMNRAENEKNYYINY